MLFYFACVLDSGFQIQPLLFQITNASTQFADGRNFLWQLFIQCCKLLTQFIVLAAIALQVLLVLAIFAQRIMQFTEFFERLLDSFLGEFNSLDAQLLDLRLHVSACFGVFNGGRQFGKFLAGFTEHLAVQFLLFQAKFFNVFFGDGDRVGFGLCNLQLGGQHVRTLKQPLRFRYLLREILTQHVVNTEVEHFSDVRHSVGRFLALERMRAQRSKVRVRVVSGLTEREHLGNPLTRNGLRALVRFQIHTIDFDVILGRRLLHLGDLAVKLPLEFDLRILAAKHVLLTGAARE